MLTKLIAPSLLFSVAACLAEQGTPDPDPDLMAEPADDVGKAVIAVVNEDDCHAGPVAEPQSCIDYAWQCGVVNVIGVANDVLSQMDPGCDPWDGIDMIADACSIPDRGVGENLAIWACNVLECLPASASANPQVVAANAACAAGTVLATAIRCAALSDLCETERRNAQPICPGDNPCPYRPSVGACDAGGSPRDASDITRDCGVAVGGLGVTGPTHSSCMASCVSTTLEATTSCWAQPDDDVLCEIAEEF